MQTMLMLKKGMMLVGLIFFSLPANAGCTLEETARNSARRCPINQLVN
ncbi:hypothetical protein QP187_07855 [Escherichia coli]|nr:hypothetical protein [Escherichia coli]MDK6481350.1 hypothetical protein [Escherichia coli]